MSYCSDMMNLQSLNGGDRTQGPRARLQAARQQVQALEQQLEIVTTAMIEAASEGVPLTSARKARQLEHDLDLANNAVQHAERELATALRQISKGAEKAWQELASGVEAQDVDTRLKARQLIADTFERITVWHHGMRPNPDASERDYYIDLVLTSKSGNSRMLRVNRDGSWVHGDEVDVTVYPITTDDNDKNRNPRS